MSDARTKRLNESQNPVTDYGIADDFHKLVIPKNTTTSLAQISTTEASIAYDTTLGEVVVNTGSGFTPISSGSTGTVTSVSTGTGLTGGPITTTGTISMANTAVTAGSYTAANITVDAQGRITAAANGAASGANAALSNLTNPTAINQDLNMGTNDILNAGSIALNTSSPLGTLDVVDATGPGNTTLLIRSGTVDNNHAVLTFIPARGPSTAWSAIQGNNEVLTNPTNITINPDGGYVAIGMENVLGSSLLSVLGGISSDGALDMVTHLIHNVVNPVDPQDAATKNYVDTAISGAVTNPLPNDTFLNGRNAADDDDIPLVKVDAGNKIIFGFADTAGPGIKLSPLTDFSDGQGVLGLNAGNGAGADIEAYTDVFGLYTQNSVVPTTLQFWDVAEDFYVGLKSPDTLAATTTYVLPAADGSAGSVLSTNGSAVTSWITGASGSFTTVDAKTVTVVNGLITSIV